MLKLITPLLFLILVISCEPIRVLEKSQSTDYQLYQQSIVDAILPDSSKIYYDLVPITTQNKDLKWKEFDGENYLLVVTWSQNKTYYESYLDSVFYNTGDYPIWITTTPELYNRMYNSSQEYLDVNRRLRQLLGLPPDANYKYFVEFWVNPDDLFRPCPDGEISDKQCDLCFPSASDSLHVNWINKNRIGSYYASDLYDKYPWTQLGYTYDWNPKNETHVGLSEFVIAKNANVIVEAIYTTEEYLKLK
ncbi:MAG: hypothetical protein PF541_01680 [Prolixibacteraceae bacterium]|jgi:hypothetical protein|nr:hypothetical protein [Prolixibacteraceae bacterium]